MITVRPLIVAVLAVSCLLPLGPTRLAGADTVYKVTDEKGNVTYQDHPPDDPSVKVEERQFDPDQNVIAAPETEPVRARPAPPAGATAGRGQGPGAAAPGHPQREEAAVLLGPGEAAPGAPAAPPPPAVPEPPAPPIPPPPPGF